MNSKEIFISYSSKDIEIATKVCSYLEGSGINCWIAPRNIVAGSNYPTQIVSAIKACKIVVLIASNNANASGHVSNEISLAFDSKKIIIPFRSQQFEFSDEFIYFLGRKHWIDAYKNFDEALEILKSTIISMLGSNEKSFLSSKKEQSLVSPSCLEQNKALKQSHKVIGFNDMYALGLDVDKISAEIFSLVNKVLSLTKRTDLEVGLNILEYISENWRVLLNSKDEIDSCWIFVSLNDEMFKLAKEGQLNETEININNMEFMDFPGDYNGYLLLSAIKPETRTPEHVKKHYDSLLMHIEDLSKKGIFFKEIISVPCTPMAEANTKRLGMKYICDYKFGGKIYIYDLKNIEKTSYLQQFPILVQNYKEHFVGE